MGQNTVDTRMFKSGFAMKPIVSLTNYALIRSGLTAQGEKEVLL